MSALLSRLYGIDVLDASQRATWLRDQATSAAVAGTISTDWINLSSLPFLLTAWGAELAPGAAQYPVAYRFTVMDPGSTAVLVQFGGDQLASVIAAVNSWVGDTGEVVVPGRHRVRITARFNAGAASNSAAIFVAGWLIPRGTLGL